MSPPPAHQGHLLSPAPPPISPGGHFLDSSWAQGGSWAVLAGFCLPLQHPLAGKPQPSAALFSLFSRALPPYPKHPPPHGSVLCSLARAGLHTPARRLGTCAGGQHRHRHKQKQPQKRARARWGASPAPTFTRKHGGGAEMKPQRWVCKTWVRASPCAPGACTHNANAPQMDRHTRVPYTFTQLHARRVLPSVPREVRPRAQMGTENQVQTDTHRHIQDAHTNLCKGAHLRKRVRAYGQVHGYSRRHGVTHAHT